jgi:hypothetical protein
MFFILLSSFTLTGDVLILGAIADLASLIFNSEHFTVNQAQMLIEKLHFILPRPATITRV